MLLLTGVCVYGGIVDAEHSAANAPLRTWGTNQITQEKADLRHTKRLHRYVGLTTSWSGPNQTTSNFSPIKFLYGSGVRGLWYLPIMYFKFFVFESSVVPFLMWFQMSSNGFPIHHRHNNVLPSQSLWLNLFLSVGTFHILERWEQILSHQVVAITLCYWLKNHLS